MVDIDLYRVPLSDFDGIRLLLHGLARYALNQSHLRIIFGCNNGVNFLYSLRSSNFVGSKWSTWQRSGQWLSIMIEVPIKEVE